MWALIASFLIHIALWRGALLALKISEPKEILTELDFSVSEFKAPIQTHYKRVKSTVVKKTESIPSEKANTITNRDEKEEIPNTKQESQISENGGGDYEGAYIPASSAARGPRWIGNFITSRDYPLVARKEGKDGLVVLKVRINSNGIVKDVALLSGSYEILNNVAIEKVRKAIFTPAYDTSGRPVPCEVKIPIRFKLRN